MTTTIVHHNGDTGVRYPPDESISQQKHIRAKPSGKYRISFQHTGDHRNSSRIRAHGQEMFVIQQHPYHKNTEFHIPDRPNNQYRIWISCRSFCVGLASPCLNLHRGGMLCTQVAGAYIPDLAWGPVKCADWLNSTEQLVLRTRLFNSILTMVLYKIDKISLFPELSLFSGVKTQQWRHRFSQRRRRFELSLVQAFARSHSASNWICILWTDRYCLCF